MSRPIKFRVWVPVTKQMWSPVLRSPDEMLRDARDTTDAVVMQFTGLQDKNGTDIYEGDIVKPLTYYGRLFAVEFGTQWYADDAYSEHGLGYNLNPEDVNYEVIGNIYEHPELLSPKAAA